MSGTLAVPKVAVPAWDALNRALTDYQPPCTDDPDLWWSADADDIEAACWRCRDCRVLELCGEYADAADEPAGVWSGVDRERPVKENAA